jgi:hypothetical protein
MFLHAETLLYVYYREIEILLYMYLFLQRILRALFKQKHSLGNQLEGC